MPQTAGRRSQRLIVAPSSERLIVAPSSERLIVATPSGDAWVDLDLSAAGVNLLLVVGHGAGGSVQAPDLLAVRAHVLEAGISVARVTQPYRVAGKKAPPRAPVLDAAWQAVLATLALRLPDHRQVHGGRSSGARVACRAAAATAESVEPDDAPGKTRLGAPHPPPNRPRARPIAVMALAFPLHPPGHPEKSRIAELAAVHLPTLVVQGSRDPFGMPPPAAHRTVVAVPSDHSLKVGGRAGRREGGGMACHPAIGCSQVWR